MDFLCQFRCQNEKRRWIFVVGLVAVTHILFQFLLLPYGNALRSLLPDSKAHVLDESKVLGSSVKTLMVGNPLAVNVSDLAEDSMSIGVEKDIHISNVGGVVGHVSEVKGRETGNGFASEETDLDNIIELIVENKVDNDSLSENDEDLNERIASDSVEGQENGSILELTSEARHELPLEQIAKPNQEISTDNHTSQTLKESGPPNTAFQSPPIASPGVASLQNNTYLKNSVPNTSSFVGSAALQSNLTTSKNNSSGTSNLGKKKMRCEMLPKSVKTIDEMNCILVQHRRSSHSMKPRWSSKRDEEILAARSQIDNASKAMNDGQLYAPVFQNVSMFKSFFLQS